MSETSKTDIADEILMLENFRITRILIRIANSTDAKDWAKLRAQFADVVVVDLGRIKALDGMRADDLVASMKLAYGHITTQHMVTNHEIQIDGEIAKVVSYGRLLHRQVVSNGDDFWCLLCRYDHELTRTAEGWKVTAMKMTPILQQGNSSLVRQAFADLRSSFHVQL